jgi:2-dehydro-3-deoxyphosphogluconate aldolase/(4S)-4-hydroxy-2-oxoglutarate aldolase
MIPEVGKIVVEAGLLWSPGCMTVSEIMVAEQVGSQLIKLFPGNLLGPSYIGAIKEIFPGLAFMPTGGVELERDNITAWFKAGACAVGMGSKLVSKPLMESEKYDTIEERARFAINLVTNYRKPEAEKQEVQ